ncbi:hypothetical protein KC332_g9913 [Hortaea werneckii]|nr:hypothetical protein KC358_g15058 [Hortaea werneckii]KAI6833910.1 hypothetical protein KC350_g6851 [Hortaea werneckii]KAI6936294.1 hypothetical protein KC341_g6324 [Hortaea werneckii]KAI6949139.1 hypothetical protein KC348_g1529 [Hortaea werneckii]KAI6961268.1 hypothetical protein KC329_g16767 [Hortaea werneckii]
MSRILPLPSDAVAQIYSSKNITSLQGVVLALLENCLDASATKIDILVDFGRGSCVLEDNGLGIPPEEFTKEGGLGRMYHTSKHASAGDVLHGRTGTYLAQVAALSLLTITSRHHHSDEYATLTLHQGKIIARNFPAPIGHELFHVAHGTRVAVRDLFGNMPVRVKQRALAGAPSSDEEKAWNELKRGVVALLLAWPKPCAIKLRNAEKSDKYVSLHSSHPNGSAALTERSIRQLSGKASEYDLRDALPLVFQAGLAPYESRAQWIAVSTSAGAINVKGLICLNPAPTKLCQFISIGIHPCSRLGGHNELYEVVNKTFSFSSFGAINDTPDLDEAEKERRLRDQRYKNDGYTQRQLHGRKGVDRHPMFVLQVKLSDGHDHHAAAESPSESHLKNIIDVLEATATQWLAANHFRPRKRRQKMNRAPTSAARMSSPRPYSAVPTSTGSALAEDNLKRPATLASTMSLKKRRLDPPGRIGTPVEPALEGASSYFNGLSRIKSGSARESIGVESAFPGNGSKSVESIERPNSSVFKLPALEAGQLNSATTMQSFRRHESDGSPRLRVREDTPPTAGESSDYFASIPDDELLTGVEPTRSHGSPAAVDMSHDAGNSTNDEVLDWTDPLSKESFKVNARTGIVLPSRTKKGLGIDSSGEQNTALPRTPAAIDTSLSSKGQAVSLSRRTATAGSASGHSWLPGFLREWGNPVFAKQDEEPIPVASFDGPGIDATERGSRQCTHNSMTQGLPGNVFGCTAKLSKEALKDVQVIRQVDNKFILCKMPSSQADGKRASTLVLVDQHAASERVILENLLQELCAPIDPASRTIMSDHFGSHTPAVKTVLLDRPQRFQIGAQEADLFTRHIAHFARWGIMYHISPSTPKPCAPANDHQTPRTEEEHRLLIVRALPPGIAGRCTLFPTLLIEMLRSEIWRRAESSSSSSARAAPLPSPPPPPPPQPDIESSTDDQSHRPAPAHTDPSPHEWLKHLHTCPKPLLDLLNSRACRSAIMFNDVLSHEECRKLLEELNRCAFPFMCAHGRVSMVPLMEVSGEGQRDEEEGVLAGRGGISEAGGDEKAEEEGFVEAFRRFSGRRAGREV